MYKTKFKGGNFVLNFITQQRRGTTEEWAKSTVIPQAGEFVIEECKNALIRIKLGDGVHLFKDLKYIDDATVSALTDLEARYNAHVAYIEGGSPVPDSTLATEVLDARYIDGTSYASLNAAIQGVSDKRVSGMVYDYEGELGLKQPYMLYLTDKDNNIIEETGVRIISGAGGGSGGGASGNSLKIGYITPSPFVVTSKDTAKIKFTFSGTDSSGDEILQASATWRIDGAVVAYTAVNSGENEFDATKYLKSGGTIKILLTVVDDAGAVATKTWSVQQIDLRLESTFNDKITYDITKPVLFNYTPYGAVDKKLYLSIDGNPVATIDSPVKLSGNPANYALPAQPHGAHLVEMYAEATVNNNKITSNRIAKDILWYDSNSNDPVIGVVLQNFTAKQYDTTNIEYTVYDPTTENPEVIIAVDGEEVSTVTLTNPTNIFAYNTAEVGSHTITLTCRNITKTLTCVIEKLDIDINPVTVGLAFDFNPVGKSNDDADKLWSDGDITMSVSDNFDWVNGGYKQDANGDTYFCIKSGTTATINYNLFEDDAKQTGKEMKLIFKTTNVANPDTIFMSCLDNTTDKDHIGIKMQPHAANIYGQNGRLELAYSENDVVEFEFNISAITEAIPMVMGYEDGVPTRPMVYNTAYSFQQNTPKPIVFGCNDCDVHIYRMKVYSVSLSNVDILNNFIADARTTEEMRARYSRNQIYDENQKLDPNVLAEKCPWLRVYKLSAPHFTNNKSDKVPDTTIQQLYKGGDPILDNWIAHNAQHSGQGTSSNNYGAAGRNLDFIMNKGNAYIELGDGTITDNITLSRTSVPVAYLNAKVNIASSNNLTNAILANRYNQFNPYHRPFVRDTEDEVKNIKDTMEFYNCVIFIQETDPDVTTHREFADTDWHFYAIGNIGDSKKTDDTRATDPDDKYECCVEIMDVALPLSDWPVDTMYNAMGYTVDETTKEPIYTWAKDENLPILYEKIDGNYVLTSDTTVDLTKTYYVDILEHDDFSEDYTYGWRYLWEDGSDEENKEVFDYCKQKWIELYRFITTSSDADFKAHLKDYFVVDSALYYYLFTTRYCMVDNRAKNTFWHYSKTADGTRKWDLCWDYDNDTSLGLNNYGKQVYRYGLEDIDRDETGTEVFREMDSTFFCRLRDNFGPELRAMYNDLESKNAWHAASFLTQCDAWQEQFPEELWRIDIERKYIRTYTTSFINGPGDSQFLENMCNGRMKYQRRQWERSQERYMASKYQTAAASGDAVNAQFRAGSPSSDNPVVLPDYQFTLTPYSYMYLTVRYGGTGVTPITIRVDKPGEPVTVPYQGTYNDLIYVYSASDISDFGDLSSMYLKTASIGNAPRVKRFILGNDTDGYENPNFTSLTTGSNSLLEELNIENITGLESSLDLSKMTNLSRLYATGANITGVIFAKGGKIARAELPALNSLELEELQYLKTENLILENFDNVVELTVANCPLIDSLALLTSCSKLVRARLLDVNITTDYEFFKTNIFKLNGLDADGKVTPDAWITGTAHFDKLTGTQLQELKTRYPHMNVQYDELTCTVQYKLSVNSDPIYTQTVHSYNNILVDCVDPVELNMIERPTKESSVSHTYDYAGWSILPDGIPVDPSPLIQVEEDLILYPTFNSYIRQYKVSFYNNDNTLLNTYDVDYGTTYFNYPDKIPMKAGVNNSEAYKFLRWNPEPENITGDLDCYATYELKPESIYTLILNDFDYEVDTVQKTLHITNYTNEYNKIIKIAEDYLVDGEHYVVTRIGGFNEKSLEYVELPVSLVELDAYAFYNNKDITTIMIPEFVSRLGAGAFAQCTGLTDVYYNATDAVAVRTENNNPYVFNNTFSKLGYTVHVGNKVKKIPSYVFSQATDSDKTLFATRKVVFDKDSCCETLESYAFWKTHCDDVTLPDSLTTIGSSAFEYSQFKCVELPHNLIRIDSDSFSHCSELEYMYIPKSIETISSAALRYSLNVELDIEEESKFVWINHCLIDTSAKKLLMGRADSIIPSDLGITSIADHCFTEVDIENLIVPEGVTSIGQYSFYNCKKLTNLALPTTLIQLQSFAIYGCGFAEIILPMNLQSMGTFALVDNINLLNLTIPSSTRSIGYRSFRGCTALQHVTFECDELTIPKPDSEPYDLFMYDTNLTNIQVNWAHEDAAFANINKDAPWKAGTNSSEVYVNPVTVRYTDKTLVYNIDGTVNELINEQSV